MAAANTSTAPQIQENLPSTPQTKLGLCEVCAAKDAKYCCPRCEVKTCSLRCNKIHKLEVECNGARDRTKFIAINKFTNLDLSSDYRLLEEATRVVDASKKGRGRFGFGLNKRFLILQQQAMERKMSLKFLPAHFVRHKSNSTRYNIALKLIEWHIDFIFVNCENLKLSLERVSENLRLSTILNKFFETQQEEDVQDKLQFYQTAGLSGIKILLKAEQKSGRKFYELDSTFTLKDCLKRRIIIEYPTIHLVLKDQATFYDILDSDDDEDCKRELQKHIKSGQEVINKIIKKSESDESLYDSLRNLLFISEYSDGESE